MPKGRVIAFAVLTVGLAVAVIWRPDPNGRSVCMSRNLLNVSCPGCGMTRSVTAAAHGDLRAAFRFHAFGPFLLVGGAVVWGLLGAGLAARRKLVPDLDNKWWTIALVTWLVLLMLYWVVRLITRTTP